MNQPYPARIPPGPSRASRLPARRHGQDLPTRLGRARLVYLLGRSGQPLTDWLPLCMATVFVGLLFLAGNAPGMA
jgi:hypothetical protein